MNVFWTIVIEITIITLIVLYASYHLIKDLRKYVPALYRKWVKGECRHFCLFCDNYNVCKIEMGLEPDYQKGFDDGYKEGYEDCQRVNKMCKDCLRPEKYYNDGFNDGFNEGKQYVYDAVIALLDKKN